MNDALLTIDSVSFSYGEQKVLNNICFDAHKCERVGLVGPNGAGKSTLFLCITGVLGPLEGEIRLQNLCSRNRADIRKMRKLIGMVFQSTEDQIFNPTVVDDVAFGPLNQGMQVDDAVRKAHEALHSVGIGHELLNMPPHQLSAGQRRRVALAGVLAMEPELLLLDEPASDLDPRGRRGLLELLSSLTSAMVIASHDLDLILMSCNRTIVIDRGEIVADGLSREVLADEKLMLEHGLEVPALIRPRV